MKVQSTLKTVDTTYKYFKMRDVTASVEQLET
jgi:hypothetical protein